MAQQAYRRNVARVGRLVNLVVDKLVVEVDVLGIDSRVAVVNLVYSAPINRAQTHRARLARGVDNTSVQFESAQLLARVSDCRDLGVCRWGAVCRHAVNACGNKFAVLNDYRAKRTAAVLHVLDRW